MILADTKKEEHVVEYILFLWQIEDLVRAAKFNPEVLENWAEETALREGTDPEKEKAWIVGIASSMRTQGKEESGHTTDVSEPLVELAHLHEMLLGPTEDLRYKEAFDVAKPMLKELKKNTSDSTEHPVEQLLIGLYGWLLLRMKKQAISAESEAGFVAFRNWANALAKGHLKIYYGK
ncbi:MAG TPA: DUF4924 family protein [Flavobacteriales bacterium]|jgi:hypothetical protein|nr:DUF4924 family protein [Flavobacteriales bacterium]HHZ95109.1 DUF4924 family protein [Flavobacteriales bacterium]HIB77356.1 DUF4924 family protein [Flavobacteriales bacterium]HIO58893.1 DUF4924 family protein [Flavobacteriales bacterium]